MTKRHKSIKLFFFTEKQKERSCSQEATANSLLSANNFVFVKRRKKGHYCEEGRRKHLSVISRASVVCKMNNTTCANFSTSAVSGHLNTTFQLNFTNSSANSSIISSASRVKIYEMYSSTATIIAYSVVYSVISIIALAGRK